LNEAYVEAQADVMAAKLKAVGFTYINLDAGWAKGLDAHGRKMPDPAKFPGGIEGLAAYVHGKGLKVGIYLTPGLHKDAWQANGTVEGTQIHLREIADTSHPGSTVGKNASYRIDFTKPGARAFIQSQVDLLASWGVDYIKMDFVGPGGGRNQADSREELKVWHDAILKSGRPIWLELSNSLNIGDIRTWKEVSNGWRIDGDVEAYSKNGLLTRWANVMRRFTDAPKWASFAGPGGWNDLDSLEIGNGENDGLTMDERKSIMTLWAISCSPLILGADLTKLDNGDLTLLTNARVLAVDQAGLVATPLSQASPRQVWRVKNRDGSYTVALFNLGQVGARVLVAWVDLGLSGPVSVRDLWENRDLREVSATYDAMLAPHACQLLRVQPQ
jgi:hypothetical protein